MGVDQSLCSVGQPQFIPDDVVNLGVIGGVFDADVVELIVPLIEQAFKGPRRRGMALEKEIIDLIVEDAEIVYAPFGGLAIVVVEIDVCAPVYILEGIAFCG